MDVNINQFGILSELSAATSRYANAVHHRTSDIESEVQEAINIANKELNYGEQELKKSQKKLLEEKDLLEKYESRLNSATDEESERHWRKMRDNQRIVVFEAQDYYDKINGEVYKISKAKELIDYQADVIECYCSQFISEVRILTKKTTCHLQDYQNELECITSWYSNQIKNI